MGMERQAYREVHNLLMSMWGLEGLALFHTALDMYRSDPEIWNWYMGQVASGPADTDVAMARQHLDQANQFIRTTLEEAGILKGESNAVEPGSAH